MKRIDPAYVTAQIHSLLARFPELADDEELRLDTLEAETDAKILLEQLIRRMAEADSYDEGIGLYIKELGTRRERMRRRSEVARELIFKIMEVAEIRNIELAEATLSIRNGVPKVIITDESLLPEQFVKVERTPMKKEIGTALKDGTEIPGASLSNGEATLSVRMA